MGTNLCAFDLAIAKGPPDDDDDDDDDAGIDKEDACIDEEDADDDWRDDDCNDGVNFFSTLRFIELICY